MKKFKLRTRDAVHTVYCGTESALYTEVCKLAKPSGIARMSRLVQEVSSTWKIPEDFPVVLGNWLGPVPNMDIVVECTKLDDNVQELSTAQEIPQEAEPVVYRKTDVQLPSAESLLQRAADIMTERGKQYDSTGQNKERSMGRIVAAFNALYGTALTEQQGWHFMLLVKLARQQTKPHADSMEDAIAYAALAGEVGFASLVGDASSGNSAAEQWTRVSI